MDNIYILMYIDFCIKYKNEKSIDMSVCKIHTRQTGVHWYLNTFRYNGMAFNC